MEAHSHKFRIADEEAMHVLFNKLLLTGAHQERREKLLRSLEQVSKKYMASTQKERQAFFHGLLTGYAVALKLW